MNNSKNTALQILNNTTKNYIQKMLNTKPLVAV